MLLRRKCPRSESLQILKRLQNLAYQHQQHRHYLSLLV
jgi:hypothetical protein